MREEPQKLTDSNIGYNRPLSDINIDEVKNVFDVNVFGLAAVTKAFIPFLIESKGKVVNIGSVAGLIPNPFFGIYNATKAAVDAYSRTLRVELKPFDVEVINIHTGSIATNFYDNVPSLDLPENSIWLPFKSAIEKFGSELPPNSTPAEEYARQVVKKTSRKHTAGDLWLGKFASPVWFFSTFLP
jgi:1-acylglycerone phosphate reductase